MTVRCIHNSIFNSCTYVLAGDEGSWLVDCGDAGQVGRYVQGELRGILLTHAHYDHIYGMNEVLRRWPAAVVVTNTAGQAMLQDAKKNLSFYHETPMVIDCPENIQVVAGNDTLPLMDGVACQVAATPGHNASCLTYVLDGCIFTGDSYIPGVKVVTNLPGGNRQLAADSLSKILTLAEGKTIYPGHFLEENNTL